MRAFYVSDTVKRLTKRLTELVCIFKGHTVIISLDRCLKDDRTGRYYAHDAIVWCDRCYRSLNVKDVL